MEISFDTLDVIGYHNQPVPNTLITHPKPAKHLGIILPGYRFSSDMPPLHYIRRVLLEQEVDTLSIDYAYYQTNFMSQSDREQDQWISADVFAACNAILSQHVYEKITLVGKSLGTIAIGHLLADRRFQEASCIWLTPLLTVDWLRARIEQIHPHSLFIIGTADQFYQSDILNHLEDVTNGQAVVIEDANHALEIPSDLQKSLMVLERIVTAVQEFLDEGTQNG